MSQPPAQYPETCVPQSIVGHIKLSQCLGGLQDGRKVLTCFGCEGTAVQAAGDNLRWVRWSFQGAEVRILQVTGFKGKCHEAIQWLLDTFLSECCIPQQIVSLQCSHR